MSPTEFRAPVSEWLHRQRRLGLVSTLARARVLSEIVSNEMLFLALCLDVALASFVQREELVPVAAATAPRTPAAALTRCCQLSQLRPRSRRGLRPGNVQMRLRMNSGQRS